MTMRKLKDPTVGQLVVVSRAPDATVYRIAAIDVFMIKVVDAAAPELAASWHDVSIFAAPTVKQLERFVRVQS
jgi:hypothetical protein